MNKIFYSIKQSPLWGLSSRKRLCTLLRIESCDKLEKFLSGHGRHYKEFDLTVNGKSRRIITAIGEMKIVHESFSRLIRRVETPKYHMSKKNHSSNIHAKFHSDNDYLFTTDIRDFFPTCTRERVAYSFKKHFKMSGDIAFILSKLLCYQDKVSQGCHPSDMLSFWSNRSMFDQINDFCENKGFLFSLYVDDVAISSKEKISHNDRYQIIKILRKNGFDVKKNKTKYFKKGSVKHITGVVIKRGRIEIENSKRKKFFSFLDISEKNNKDSLSAMGLYYYCRNIDPEFAPTLEKRIKKLLKEK